MALAQIGEAHQIIMRIGNKQGFDEVFRLWLLLPVCRGRATLRLIVGGRLGFDIAAVSQGNDHFALRNQVFIGNVAAERVDFAAALVAEIGFGFFQFFADDLVIRSGFAKMSKKSMILP